MNDGWIKLHRKMKDWEWYRDTNAKIVFLHLLLSANWEKRKYKGETLQRGDVYTSLPELGAELHLSPQQLRTALNKLESTGEITTRTTGRGRVITLTRYSTYNPASSKNNRLDNRDINRIATGSSTGFQQGSITGSESCYQQADEDEKTLIEYGIEPIESLLHNRLSTDESTDESTVTLTGKTTGTKEGTKEERTGTVVEEASLHHRRPHRFDLVWEKMGQTSPVPSPLIPTIPPTSENSQTTPAKYPQRTNEPKPETGPVVDVEKWEQAAANGDSLGALGHRIGLLPDKIKECVETIGIPGDVFEAWLLDRAAADFRTPKANKPIGFSNWQFDLQGFWRKWQANEDRNNAGKRKTKNAWLPDNWRDIAAELTGEDCSGMKRWQDIPARHHTDFQLECRRATGV